MAATESRTGFRLPWSTEEKATGQREDAPSDADRRSDAVEAPTAEVPTAEVPTAEVPTAEVPTPFADTSAEASSVTAPGTDPEPADPPTEAVATEEASVHPTAAHDVLVRSKDASPKKPSKFMADLTRAMQAAAESSRASTLEQFQAEAKSHIEEVQARSADGATELRKTADDDIVTIREWSKSELSRIREETDRKITTRKTDLEAELEDYAARIERRVERIQVRVAAFETEMDRFFERLLNEDDAAEFAAMAENLPEPPPFDFEDADAPTSVLSTTETAAQTEIAPEASLDAAGSVEPEAATGTVETTDVSADASAETSTDTLIGSESEDVAYAVQDDPAAVEAAMAAIEAAYRAAGETNAEPSSDAAAAETGTDADTDAEDPRLAALGLSPDLDAAEAEAAASAADSSDDEIPTLDDEALAARLAGLVAPAGSPAPAPRAAAPKAAASSQVVVTGLVSVASIASFKRHIGRIVGVQSVGVSSGPDGEFVFKVAHGGDVVLADAIPSLPGFEARVTGTGEGVINVSARDPESEG